MDQKDLEFEQTLADSEALLKNTARSMDNDAEFSLESILAEYGGRAEPEANDAAAPPAAPEAAAPRPAERAAARKPDAEEG